MKLLLPRLVKRITSEPSGSRGLNLTSQDFAELIEREQIREKLINVLKRDFPKHKGQAEDWAARAILYGMRKARAIKPGDERGALAYVMEAGPLLATKDLERSINRRKSLEGEYYDAHGGVCKLNGKKLVRYHDPYRQIDYKVDLEKAIRLTTGNKTMQQALWSIHFEKWTWDEVIEALPKDILPDTWRKRIMRTNEELQRRLRAYGYRG